MLIPADVNSAWPGASNAAAIVRMRQRADFAPAVAPLLEALARLASPADLQQHVGRPLAGYYCAQTPVELLYAMGYQPVHLHALVSAEERRLPTAISHLACPLANACLAVCQSRWAALSLCEFIVLPLACDWITKTADWLKAAGYSVHIMEVPREQQNAQSRQRWSEEVRFLLQALERRRSRAICRRALRRSIAAYAWAWELLARLRDLRQKGKISGLWFFTAAQAIWAEKLERWCQYIQQLIAWGEAQPPLRAPRIFLGGSPLFFPEAEIISTIENAGLCIADDNLCACGRLLAGPAVYEDDSVVSLCRAVAERHYIACACPTAIDASGRSRIMLESAKQNKMQGIVYVIQQGCHPCAAEAISVEKEARSAGMPYLRLEVSAAADAMAAWRVRLEAFGETLSARIEKGENA